MKIHFCDIHPSKWKEDESYAITFEIVRNIKFVNNCIQTAVKFMENFNGKLTKGETQQQFTESQRTSKKFFNSCKSEKCSYNNSKIS